MPPHPDNPKPETAASLDSPLFCNLDAHRVMLQAIIDHSPADIYLKDLEGKYLLVNRNFGERVGMDPSVIIGNTVHNYFTKSEADQKSVNDEIVVNEGKARQFEEVVTMSDGTHTLLSEKFPIKDENGKIYAVCGISTDITSRKAYEKKLRQLSQQIQQQGRTLEIVLSSSPNIVYMFDSQGRFLYANQSGAANFGVRPVDIIGKTLKSLKLPVGVFEPFMVHLVQVFKTGKTIKDQLEFSTPTSNQELSYTLIPIMDIRGRVVNVIAYVNDITLDREKDRMLKSQTLEINRSNEELDEFARIASHDLSEPLRLVQTHLKALNESMGSLSDESKKHLELSLEGAGRMKVLIDDLLEYARVGIDVGKFQQLKMNEVLDAVERDLKLSIQESGATITIEKLPSIWGLEDQLIQLFVQLISNGLKFNTSQHPNIDISVEQRNETWVFEVKDNGIGIESSESERVFQIFHRTHSHKNYPGTGVGLAIARKIVQLHEGTIWVKSELGQGSSFFFSLPIRHKGGHQMMIDLFGEL
ncbi:MAG: PAS domain-containing protein [Verrucomicrobia bacterium]|nr:PAS domain-containing protein [Verrucomicrobiota bacterium]MDA1065840.1 PAS domain-containing protein [Verrucomicrobiota bacterium]